MIKIKTDIITAEFFIISLSLLNKNLKFLSAKKRIPKKKKIEDKVFIGEINIL
jgi:hypothetical protein